jgi:hypothetical protein
VEVVPGEKDRTGEYERLLKVKQLIKMVIVGTGNGESATSGGGGGGGGGGRGGGSGSGGIGGGSGSSGTGDGGAKGRALLERSFRMADKDGSGELSFDEMNFCLRSDFAVKGLTPGDMRRLFSSLDVDGSGFVNSDEFVQAIEDTPLPELKHKVW